MTELEYPYSAIPNELKGLDNEHRWFLTSLKERQPDIVFLTVKNHNITYRLSKGTKGKSDPPSASRCQLAGKAKDNKIC